MEFQDKIAELRGLWGRVRLDGRRTAFFRRQELQERAEALQGLQGQARGAPGGRCGDRSRARRNHDQLLGLRQGNDRAVPADAGPAGVLPGMLPVSGSSRARAASSAAVTAGVISEATSRVAFVIFDGRHGRVVRAPRDSVPLTASQTLVHVHVVPEKTRSCPPHRQFPARGA